MGSNTRKHPRHTVDTRQSRRRANLGLVLESVLANKLQLLVETFLLEGATGRQRRLGENLGSPVTKSCQRSAGRHAIYCV